MSYKPGDHLVICDICGFRKLASECRMTWNGLFSCPECFDPEHPQRIEPTGRHEKQTVKPYRPEGDPVFIETPVTPDDL